MLFFFLFKSFKACSNPEILSLVFFTLILLLFLLLLLIFSIELSLLLLFILLLLLILFLIPFIGLFSLVNELLFSL